MGCSISIPVLSSVYGPGVLAGESRAGQCGDIRHDLRVLHHAGSGASGASELTLGLIAVLVFLSEQVFHPVRDDRPAGIGRVCHCVLRVLAKGRRRLKASESLLLCMAVTFHYSAIVLLAVYLLGACHSGFRSGSGWQSLSSVWLFRQTLFAGVPVVFPVLATYFDVEVSPR